MKIKYIYHLFLVYEHVYTSYGGIQRIQIDARRSTTWIPSTFVSYVDLIHVESYSTQTYRRAVTQSFFKVYLAWSNFYRVAWSQSFFPEWIATDPLEREVQGFYPSISNRSPSNSTPTTPFWVACVYRDSNHSWWVVGISRVASYRQSTRTSPGRIAREVIGSSDPWLI